MDPITTSIVAALAVGVAGSAKQVGQKVLVDAYDALKAAIKNKYGIDSNIAQAVTKLEKEPDFEPNQAALAGRVEQGRRGVPNGQALVPCPQEGTAVALRCRHDRSGLDGRPQC